MAVAVRATFAAMHLSTVEAELAYEVREPSHVVFQLEAARWPTQRILGEHLSVSPQARVRSFEHAESGNRFLRVDAPPGLLEVHYKADVEVDCRPLQGDLRETPVGEVPDAVMRYLLPSRFCESDLLCAFAREQFGASPPGLERVRRITAWIHREMAYRPGSTGPTTTAREALAQRAGVCRDFAHVGVAFCRALSIPARLVAGYVWFDVPPQDFHAVFEAWLDGRWVMFDPTGMAPVDRLVRIGTGRDAKDVAFCTIFGTLETIRQAVAVLEHDPRPPGIKAALAPAASTAPA